MLEKFFLNFSLVVLIGFFFISIGIVFFSIPRIVNYEELDNKYSVLVNERMRVLKLTENLERLNQMDEFVRNSLGSEFNFSEKPEIIDAIQSSGKLEENTEKLLVQAIEEYKKANK